MAVRTPLPPTPLDQYVSLLGLDAPELEALLAAIERDMLDGDRETRALLQPCREAILGELRAIGA